MRRQVIEMALSWGRVFLAAVLAQLMAGVSDWSIIINASLMACLPVIIRALDPLDTVYGRGAQK